MGLGTSATSFIDQTLDFTCDVCFAQGKVHKERLLCFCILNNTQHSVIHYVLL